MDILRPIAWFIYFFGYMILHKKDLNSGLQALEAGDETRVTELVNRHVPHWCSELLRRAGVSVQVEGRENIPKGVACVFVANHRSYYDIPLMLTQLDAPHALVSKIEVSRIPLVRGWMRLLHCVFVDRGDARQSIQCLSQATENVRAGYSVTIFPEGTRYKGAEGGLGEFKGGAFRIATRAGAPLVPVVIHGSRAIMEDNGGWMKPAHVRIEILPPIETEGLDRQALKALPGRTEALIREKLAEG